MMNNFFIYMIQVSVSMTILYGIYWAFLRKDTFFVANRFYLLGSLLISSTISFFDFSWLLPRLDNSYVILLDAITISNYEIQGGIQEYLSTFQIILIIYLSGVTIFLLRYIFRISQLLHIIYTNKVKRNNGFSIISLEKPVSPFSFFNYIVLPYSDYSKEDVQGIVDHELINVKQKHTFDILVTDLLSIAFWFNPIIWLYRKSIKSIHEYLADEGVLVKGYKTNFYQNLLLNQTLRVQVNYLTNNFNQSLIKRRFIMMSKSRSSTMAKLKLLLVLPAIMAIITLSMVGENIIAQEKAPSALVVEPGILPLATAVSVGIPIAPQPTSLPQEGKKVYKEVDKEPQFPGGSKAMEKFIQTEFSYPKSALKNNVSAVIYVNFVVEKNGVVSDVTVGKTKFKPHDASKDDQKALMLNAIKVVSNMPDWKPAMKDGKSVNAEMTLPVKFFLDSHKKDTGKSKEAEYEYKKKKEQEKKKKMKEEQLK